VVRFTEAKYQQIADRLGYEFKDRALLRLALTHASVGRANRDYERLEFLGDRVLGLIIAEKLYLDNPAHQEGHMASRHSALVRGDLCAEIARIIGLQDFIQLGRKESELGVHLSSSVLGDAMEAVIAAIYLDGGLDAARHFVLRFWETSIANKKAFRKDAKTYLQEWALAQGHPIPAYTVKGREGPDHAPVFVIEVAVGGHAPAAGEGVNKRLAEQAAAEAFLGRENLRK
jgi:ribonuclease-3